MLEQRRLLPLLGARLASACHGQVAQELEGATARAHARDRARAMKVDAATVAVVKLLADAGVDALALKGTGLAQDAHGDIGLRASADIDLLVAPRDLPRAFQSLRARGYEADEGHLDADRLPLLHFALDNPELPRVDLHWRVHWHESRFSVDMLRRARRVPGDCELCADPADDAAALLLFFARDGFYGLRIAADVGGWWDRQGATLPPGILDAHVSRYPELRRVWHAAALAAERYVGVPLEFWFSAAPPPDRRRDLALRLGNWSQAGDVDQLAANISLVDGLLAPPGSIRPFMSRVLAAAPDAGWLHLVKTVARFVTALWRIRKGSWVLIPR